MNVVLDTNVVVSGLVHRGEAPQAVIQEIRHRQRWLCNLSLALEYGAVLTREKFSRVVDLCVLKRAAQELVADAEPVMAHIRLHMLADEEETGCSNAPPPEGRTSS